MEFLVLNKILIMFTKFFDFSKQKQPYEANYTQPNMSFTPRQIIEQFASGEVIARENQPSDDFYDDKYSDDDLASVTQIDDDFQARQLVIDFQIEQENETNASNSVRRGSDQGAAETTQNVPIRDVSNDMVDSNPPGA